VEAVCHVNVAPEHYLGSHGELDGVNVADEAPCLVWVLWDRPLRYSWSLALHPVAIPVGTARRHEGADLVRFSFSFLFVVTRTQFPSSEFR